VKAESIVPVPGRKIFKVRQIEGNGSLRSATSLPWHKVQSFYLSDERGSSEISCYLQKDK
jgi:hypothetical protein